MVYLLQLFNLLACFLLNFFDIVSKLNFLHDRTKLSEMLYHIGFWWCLAILVFVFVFVSALRIVRVCIIVNTKVPTAVVLLFFGSL